jgi:hypothetical protein
VEYATQTIDPLVEDATLTIDPLAEATKQTIEPLAGDAKPKIARRTKSQLDQNCCLHKKIINECHYVKHTPSVLEI